MIFLPFLQNWKKERRQGTRYVLLLYFSWLVYKVAPRAWCRSYHGLTLPQHNLHFLIILLPMVLTICAWLAHYIALVSLLSSDSGRGFLFVSGCISSSLIVVDHISLHSYCCLSPHLLPILWVSFVYLVICVRGYFMPVIMSQYFAWVDSRRVASLFLLSQLSCLMS